jgi:Zn-dependent protease
VAFAVIAQRGGMFGSMTSLEIGLVIAFLILSLTIHEACHALVATLCGDTTARDLGRLTLNPIPHIDPFMTILLPVVTMLAGGVFLGGAKPVPVSYHRLRHPLRDMMLVAIAGPLSNLLLAVLFVLAGKVAVAQGYPANALMPRVLEFSAVWNVFLAVFNLVPIPPLDGSRIMTWILPSSIRDNYLALERFGLLIIFGILWFVPSVGLWIRDTSFQVLQTIDVLTGSSW